ncbi:ABC transporter permease [Streptomyces termitum]|uniref:ABC transporter membrane-spanning protein n=1 Tax=Streptomyces termitum TaxID=67368 RepID=A0A918T9X7_9ACTN|nr:ABC transporter permease [Streptomyces termitum]GHA97183.1 ABC transporter membrane-spanning protein [Streptomyces termitum]
MNAFAGTGVLTRLALRRDRLTAPLWALVTGGLVASGPGSLGGLYDTPAARAELAASMTANSSMRAFYGPVYADSLGGLTAWRFGTFAAVLAAVAGLIVVVRHTREEEETGRQELLSAGAVGRRAPLTAALLAALAVNTGAALLVVAGLAGQGLAGALALALAVGGTGMVFATVAAIAAQLTESARLAKGLTAAALGLAFALRAAGDAGDAGGNSPLTWLSPLGWTVHVRPYGGDRWAVLLLIAAAVVLQTLLAYGLAARRDVGASFLAARPGPATGRLSGAGALALRLQRGALAGWGTGFLLGGLVFGGMAEGAADLVGDNEKAREIFARMGGQQGMTDAFLATLVSLFGLLAALYAVGAVLRAHGEETSGRAEPLLAAPLGRLRWAAGHLLPAFAGSALLLALSGLGLTLSYGRDAGPLLGASLAQLPAVWTLAGAAVLLWGAVPRAAGAAWGAAGLCLALGWIGPALDLPRAVLDLSPYAHLPKLPGGPASWTGPLVLTVLAAVLTAAGLAGLRRRDLRF